MFINYINKIAQLIKVFRKMRNNIFKYKIIVFFLTNEHIFVIARKDF